MADKQIRVDEKVHKKITKIAEANFRGIGDQIAYWAANDCPHPIEMRQEKNVQVTVFTDGDSIDQTLRVFYCKQCRHHVVIDGNPAELGEKLDQIVSK